MSENMEIILSTVLVCIAVFVFILGFIGIKGMKKQGRKMTASRVIISNALYQTFGDFLGRPITKKEIDKFLRQLKKRKS